MFEQGDALLVVDVFDTFDHEDAAPLLASFRARVPAMEEALSRARAAGVPVVFVNDDHDSWDGDFPRLVRDALAGPGGDALSGLIPADGESRLVKHRYSAFDHTALDLLLERQATERVVIIGAATEGCVVQTAIDAREHDLKATILTDACATTDAQLEETALAYARDVGGIRLVTVA